MPLAWRDILAALGLLAFSAWYAWLASELPERSLPNTPGPSFFPLIVIALVAALSVALLVRGGMALRAPRGADRHGAFSPTAALMLASFAVYLALLPLAGFIVASMAFFATLMLLYGSRNPLLIGAASTGLPIILFLIFRYGFQIVLPRGILGF
jgi:putative tricarboxylic transport membrane protein